jgi:hypothetical protein
MIEESEFDEEDDTPVEDVESRRFSEAVVFSTDWTVETILLQMTKSNIDLSPNFQRREAWPNSRKSRFIESILLGLPTPQLVLAEQKDRRGKFIVLDGKQRLLALSRFTESREDKRLGFRLSGLEIRNDLNRKKFFHFQNDAELESEKDAFLNNTIRTVIIRNWPGTSFLHQVFLRLNTGSVTLSSQELRQAMAPGAFTKFADNFSAKSTPIQSLLGRSSADPRMRDVELLVRYLAFRRHLHEYKGRLKLFLDNVCMWDNEAWSNEELKISQQAIEFERVICCLIDVFGSRLARKAGSKSFNRAIFDALSYYVGDDRVQDEIREKSKLVLDAYNAVCASADFVNAVDSDTAGIPNTFTRLRIWGEQLNIILENKVRIPTLDFVSNRILP